MRLRLIKLDEFGGVLTVPNHAKLAAQLLEEQDFYKVAVGAISTEASNGRDGTELANDAAKKGGTVDGKDFNNLVSPAGSKCATTGGSIDGSKSICDPDINDVGKVDGVSVGKHAEGDGCIDDNDVINLVSSAPSKVVTAGWIDRSSSKNRNDGSDNVSIDWNDLVDDVAHSGNTDGNDDTNLASSAGCKGATAGSMDGSKASHNRDCTNAFMVDGVGLGDLKGKEDTIDGNDGTPTLTLTQNHMS